MKIILWYDEEIESIEVPVKEVQYYINLFEEHGFQDVDGNEYEYDYSRVDSGFVMYIYLNKD